MAKQRARRRQRKPASTSTRSRQLSRHYDRDGRAGNRLRQVVHPSRITAASRLNSSAHHGTARDSLSRRWWSGSEFLCFEATPLICASRRWRPAPRHRSRDPARTNQSMPWLAALEMPCCPRQPSARRDPVTVVRASVHPRGLDAPGPGRRQPAQRTGGAWHAGDLRAWHAQMLSSTYLAWCRPSADRPPSAN